MRVVASVLLVLALSACTARAFVNVDVPPPATDEPLAKVSSKATAVIAGGCFWGIQLVYQHVKGVSRATSGYAGGTAETAKYETVGTDKTDHAESVEIEYDPSRITYGQLLRIFFSVAHDPTQLNQQWPDTGRQYRSVIFTSTPSQARIARAYVDQLNKAKTFPEPVVTEITELPRFYMAETYHQNYATLHPNDPYIRMNDAPKLERLKVVFPELYVR